jgi:hypothetical protein
MKRVLIVLIFLLSNLICEEIWLKEGKIFDVSSMSYDEVCEQSLYKSAKQSALAWYIGCTEFIGDETVSFDLVREHSRVLTTESCIVEADYEIDFSHFDKDYLRGSDGLLCQQFNPSIEQDNQRWSQIEVGAFFGLSNEESSLELQNKNQKIFYKYAQVPLYGLYLAYHHKIVNSHYIGLKLSAATSTESHNDNFNSGKTRNDGNPKIESYRTAFLWGYRYQLKYDAFVSLSHHQDKVTRNYSDGEYSADINKVNLNIGLGYFISPDLKLSGSIASDLSMIGAVSWVY